jgi:hypothetical protein
LAITKIDLGVIDYIAAPITLAASMKFAIQPVVAAFDNLSPYIPYLGILLLLILAIAFFRPILQLLGVVIIPENKIGLVTKKFALMGAHT